MVDHPTHDDDVLTLQQVDLARLGTQVSTPKSKQSERSQIPRLRDRSLSEESTKWRRYAQQGGSLDLGEGGLPTASFREIYLVLEKIR